MLDISNFKKYSNLFIIVSISCFIFGYIYEKFSHDVISNYMIYAFLIPLLLGGAFYRGLHILKIKKLLDKTFLNLYNSMIITFTIYSIVRGILEIYGTTNNLINIYLIVGVFLLITSLLIGIKNK